jgi:hypothetical protein
MSRGFSAFYDDAGRELGVEVRAFGRQQDAALRVVFDGVDFDWFHQQDGLPFRRLREVANGVNLHIANHLSPQSCELTFAVSTANFETVQGPAVDGNTESGEPGRRRALEGSKVSDRVQRGQAQVAGAGNPPVRSKRAERAVANLNGGEVPSGCETVMPISEEERFSLQSALDAAYLRGIGNRPEAMGNAEAVDRFVVRREWRMKKRADGFRFVATPKPQAAGICPATGNGFGAGGDTLRRCFFVRKNGCFIAIEQTHYAAANGVSELLPVEKQRRLQQFGKARRVDNFRRIFSRDIDCVSRRIPGAKRQQNWHANEPARIAGMAS